MKNLGFEEVFNVTFTTPEGKGIRKTRFNNERALFLIEVPENKGFVFNLKYNYEGLDNFLHLKGYNEERIQEIHREIERQKGKNFILTLRYDLCQEGNYHRFCKRT